MKTRIFLFLVALYMVAFSLVFAGKLRYDRACVAAQNCSGTDGEIEEVLYAYGFNLAWYEEPTIADYILSNFK